MSPSYEVESATGNVNEIHSNLPNVCEYVEQEMQGCENVNVAGARYGLPAYSPKICMTGECTDAVLEYLHVLPGESGRVG